ncbi:ABC transporter substrate-binding protein [Primorskyibacter flagellatus]|uniref:Carbohydrate ABC transporter substrate-binding protein, CUT1 family n=1 Tax=Primorskyibacter flagellatus TaxID=1387277 RepID=A0A1W2EDV1_9RHOB|nr:sugar ABC transporter substrate-binding protein [Primorskyibacter flagellatus]SMD07913.1 carbohydrate ABC transporter substrate-binding protein, CUT1 family [Primorskyibacter flagellatus]
MKLNRRTFLGSSAVAALMATTQQSWALSAEELSLKSGKPYAGTTINVMLPNAGQYRAQKKRLGELEELTGIKVVHTYVPYGQLLDKITAEAIAGNDDYDLVTYQDTWGPALTPYLDPLDDLVAADGFDMSNYPQVFVECSQYKDTLYGLPVRGQAQLLFYRKDLFEAAGVAPPTTIDEMVEAAKTVQESSGISGIAMDYGKGNGFQNLFSWMNYMRGHKAELLDADGNVAFNSEAGVEATKDYLRPLTEGIANPGSVQFVEGDKVTSFAEGNSAMLMVWWWGYARLTGESSSLTPEQVGFVPVPGFGNDTKAGIGQCMPFGIFKLSKNKEAAWEVLKWMAAPYLEVDIATDKSDPDTNEIIVVHTSSLKDSAVNEANFGVQEVGYESLENARAMPMLKTWPQVASVLEATISDIAANGTDVKTALDAAATQVQRIVDRNPE